MTPAHRPQRALAGKSAVFRRALAVAFVVGSALNLINQWDGFFGGLSVDWPRFLANYAVPFCVSVYSAVSARGD